MPEKSTEKPIVPASPEVSGRSGGPWLPEQIDPELANISIARDLMHLLGKPSIISKDYSINYGLVKSFNHIDGTNETGLDCSLLVAVLNEIANQSVNINGKSFDAMFQFLMKPKFVISAMMQPGQYNQEEEKQSLWDRTGGRLLGGGKKNEQQQQ
jgi:hypothetical protein